MKRIFAIAVTLALLVACAGCKKAPEATPAPTPEATATATPSPTPEAAPAAAELIRTPNQREGYSLTSGKPYTGKHQPVAVMVENTKAAYPQSGLSKADIVYEMYEEGGITRFMAIFGDQMPDKVGPIRSCRPYFVDALAEYDCILTHVGGPNSSSSAVNIYQKFRDAGIKQREDGYRDGKHIYRDSSRRAPHNCYVDLNKVQADYTYDPAARPFAFDYDDVHSYSGATVTEIDMTYNSSNSVAYKWDAEQQHYVRWFNGSPMIDMANNKQITVDNLIVQYAPHSNLNDKYGHISIQLLGEGKFEAVIGGIKVEGTWKKDSTRSATEFLVNGEEHLLLDPGVTYIQVVPTNHQVTYVN